MSEFAVERVAPGRLAVRGELHFDNATTALARGVAMIGENAECEVDLSQLRSGDSAGLAVLIEWLAIAQARGVRLRYAGVPAQVLAIARISDLDGLLRANSH